MRLGKSRPAMLAILALCALAGSAGCRDAGRDQDLADIDPIPVDDRPEAGTDVDRDFAAELGIDLDAMTRTASGLYILDLEPGTGATAEVGRHVEVHYTGWLTDGTQFDSSRGRDITLDFVLGTGAVISGWEEGIAGMREGGRRRLVIPPALAYGRDGYGVIPPYATLVFETELVQVQ